MPGTLQANLVWPNAVTSSWYRASWGTEAASANCAGAAATACAYGGGAAGEGGMSMARGTQAGASGFIFDSDALLREHWECTEGEIEFPDMLE